MQKTEKVEKNEHEKRIAHSTYKNIQRTVCAYPLLRYICWYSTVSHEEGVCVLSVNVGKRHKRNVGFRLTRMQVIQSTTQYCHLLILKYMHTSASRQTHIGTHWHGGCDHQIKIQSMDRPLVINHAIYHKLSSYIDVSIHQPVFWSNLFWSWPV